MLALLVRLHLAVAGIADGSTRPLLPAEPDRLGGRRQLGDDRGQATTEYALVLLAGALVALLVIAWATAGGGAAKVAQLFNRVIDSVIGNV